MTRYSKSVTLHPEHSLNRNIKYFKTKSLQSLTHVHLGFKDFWTIIILSTSVKQIKLDIMLTTRAQPQENWLGHATEVGMIQTKIWKAGHQKVTPDWVQCLVCWPTLFYLEVILTPEIWDPALGWCHSRSGAVWWRALPCPKREAYLLCLPDTLFKLPC